MSDKKNKRYIFEKWHLNIITVIILVVMTLTFFYYPPPDEISAVTLKELSNEISQLSSNEESLVEEIIATESLIEIKKNQIIELSDTISKIENELKELDAERESLEEQLSLKKEELRSRVIHSYKYGNDNVVKMIATARDINEFMTSMYILKNIMRRDAELISEIRLDKESYDRILRKSEEKKKQLEATQENQKKEQEVLEATLQKNK